MKSFKLLMSGLLALGMLAGCTQAPTNSDIGNAETTPTPAPTPETLPTVADTWAESFANAVLNNGQKTALDVAVDIATNTAIPFEGGVVEIEPGYLTGFDNYEVLGFDNGVMIAPMIGTIPFVSYVFDMGDATAEEVSAFEAALLENANLRWNICTSADQKLVRTVDSMVFFIMAPTYFETEGEEETAGLYVPGDYQATAEGHDGPITVYMSFNEEEITSVGLDIGVEALENKDEVIMHLSGTILNDQTLLVDALSGSTVTTEAVLSAAEDCVLQAGGDVEALKVPATE